jgi:hypothetical protein
MASPPRLACGSPAGVPLFRSVDGARRVARALTKEAGRDGKGDT